MTKIKIIGDPGQQPVEILKKWLEKYLEKFKLSYPEVYLIFVKNTRQMETLYRKYIIGSSPKGVIFSKAEVAFKQLRTTAYFNENTRKQGVPPIILIKENSKISEDDFMDEVAHMKEDEQGWFRIKNEVLKLLAKDYYGIYGIGDISKWLSLFFTLREELAEFFSSEMMCRYGLVSEALKEKEEKLHHWVQKIFPQRKRDSEIDNFNIVVIASFWTTLPPSYPWKENEQKLENITIDYIRQMSMESLWRKIRSIVSKLESPPKVSNIYKCGAEIIELAQRFLEK